MEINEAFIDALITEHTGIPRKGPGSDDLARAVMERIRHRLPENPCAADLGCGNGHSAFLLAETLGVDVTAVDFAPAFIAELDARLATNPPTAGAVTSRVGDMLEPGLAPASCDLIWSEGAAYAVGLDLALATWHPLLKPGGLLVFSECCWFERDEAPAEAVALWERGYPAMGTVGETLRLTEQAGYRFLAAEALPSIAWWESYFGPLADRFPMLAEDAAKNPVLAEIIQLSKEEMETFRRCSDYYGYVFFVLKKPRP